MKIRQTMNKLQKALMYRGYIYKLNTYAEHGVLRTEVVWMNYQQGQMNLSDFI